MPQPSKKLFVVRKYVFAKSAQAAIRLERKHKVDDCWVDDDWKKANSEEKKSAIGFLTHEDETAVGTASHRKPKGRLT